MPVRSCVSTAIYPGRPGVDMPNSTNARETLRADSGSGGSCRSDEAWPSCSPRVRTALIGFALLTWLYRPGVFIGIAVMVPHVLQGPWHPAFIVWKSAGSSSVLWRPSCANGGHGGRHPAPAQRAMVPSPHAARGGPGSWPGSLSGGLAPRRTPALIHAPLAGCLFGPDRARPGTCRPTPLFEGSLLSQPS